MFELRINLISLKFILNKYAFEANLAKLERCYKIRFFQIRFGLLLLLKIAKISNK